MRVALAQINTVVGDIAGNSARIVAQLRAAHAAGAALVVYPELTILGYPPKDLLLRRSLIRQNVEALEDIAAHCQGIAAVVGFVQPDPSDSGTGIFNAAALCAAGRVQATYAKTLLPTYDVFDELRYFNAGKSTGAVVWGGTTLGLTICEDLWNDQQFEGRRVYGVDPIDSVVRAGARWLVNISASPFRVGKQEQRERLFTAQAREHGVPILYVNLVGGNDDLIFDGASVAFDAQGRVVARAKAFCEDCLMVDVPVPGEAAARDAGLAVRIESYPESIASIRQGLVLGLRDYVGKCGFADVVLGLSGGVDSALTAALAVEALGPHRVHGVAMPSRYSSSHSLEDARELARNLGIELMTMPIEGAHQALEAIMRPAFSDAPSGVAEENIQARIRGNILMAMSNKFGWLLLTTGNKSELAVGYCTLYGDMCGGLAVLSDVPKTTVYALARQLNESAGRAVIPLRTIEKPPSAELRENQTDQDLLPPYELLDAILEGYVERELAVEDIVAQGFDRATVERVVRMVEQSEYKRRQAAIGLKVTSRAFGTGRRMPVAARFR